ncbi:MAG: hypothetical protein ACXIUQ_16725 [Cecembia sp.]
MRTKILGILFLFLAFSACKREKQDENPLAGNWYGFDSDSLYYELYISDTLIILNHETMGIAEYGYERDGDKLITTTPLFFERVWTFEELNDSLFIISDTLEKHHYKKLDITHDFFKSIGDSLALQQFKEEFIARIKSKTAEE